MIIDLKPYVERFVVLIAVYYVLPGNDSAAYVWAIEKAEREQAEIQEAMDEVVPS